MIETFKVWQLLRTGKMTQVQKGDVLYFVGPEEPQPGVYVSPIGFPLPVVQVADDMVTVKITIKTSKPLTSISEIDNKFVTKDDWLRRQFERW